MSDMYYIESNLYKRVSEKDTLVKTIRHEDYNADQRQEWIDLDLLANTSVMLKNLTGTYMLIVSAESTTANITLSLDSDQITFKNFLTTIVSDIPIQIESNTTTTAYVGLIKIV